MEQVEIEVKFQLVDRSRLRQSILQLGGVTAGRHFEVNIRFDDRRGSLRRSGSLLRLRKTARRKTVTYKSIPAKFDSRFKVFQELETTVGDFETMKQILASLRFEPQQVYEKWRETITLGKSELCLDQMPFGDFLEIEGAPDDIRSTASRLELDWERRILLNYLEIFERLKGSLKLSFSDVTFDNFRSHKVDSAAVAAALDALLVG